MSPRAAAAPVASNRKARRAQAAGKPSPFAMAFSLEDPKETDDEKKSRRAAEREKKDGESDEDYAKRCAELDDKEKAEDEKEKKEAETEDMDPDAEGTDDEKCAAARAEGFTAGGKRWQDVLTAKEAKGKGLIACHLLSSTDMTAPDITKALTALAPDGAATAHGLAQRMHESRVEAPSPAAAPAALSATGMVSAESVMAAAAKARGEVPKPVAK